MDAVKPISLPNKTDEMHNAAAEELLRYSWDDMELVKSHDVAVRLGAGSKASRVVMSVLDRAPKSSQLIAPTLVRNSGEAGNTGDSFSETKVLSLSDEISARFEEEYAYRTIYTTCAFVDEHDYNTSDQFTEPQNSSEQKYWCQDYYDDSKYNSAPEYQDYSNFDNNYAQPKINANEQQTKVDRNSQKEVRFTSKTDGIKSKIPGGRGNQSRHSETNSTNRNHRHVQQDRDTEDDYGAIGPDHNNDGAGDFYSPSPSTGAGWNSGFPQLCVPPFPTSFPAGGFRKGDIPSLLMSWYIAGYHAGYYDARQDLQRTKKT